ncbi:MAG: C4-dicarboxylate ABC transporter permease [Rhodobacteraceae bacterium]|nr:MAG: C4-dicarboxylate ABC transporter permease [Paracoccaceae bacterium]
MTSEMAGVWAFLAALFLTMIGVPVSISMLSVGVIGFGLLNGWGMAGYILGSAPFEAVFPYGLSVVPLFVGMGVFAAHAGLSRSLFDAVNLMVGRFRGGLAIAAIGACAIFGAICGSSLATAATMGRIAVPEMLRAGYAKSISAATVAAAGTLGVLIPPSVLLVIYALLTETSIGKLFAAALIPGLIATGLYIATVVISIRLDPSLVKLPEKDDSIDRAAVMRRVMPVVGLFTVVIGGLYAGFFSPTEAAAVGAIGAFMLAIVLGSKTSRWTNMFSAALETARTSSMIFMILIGAAMFNFLIEGTGLTTLLGGWVTDAGLPAWGVMLVIIVFYVILGCFMDALSMMLLTIPVVFPIVSSLGYDPIWFGILIVSVAEIGLITPPIGMNLFVIQGVAPDVGQRDIVKGIVPFIIADIFRIALLVLFPGLALFLPSLM